MITGTSRPMLRFWSSLQMTSTPKPKSTHSSLASWGHPVDCQHQQDGHQRVDYQEAKYNEVKTEVSNLLKMVGFKPDDINFIAGSSQMGENIYNKSDNMSWYNGPTLFEAIDAITMPPNQLIAHLGPIKMSTKSAV